MLLDSPSPLYLGAPESCYTTDKKEKLYLKTLPLYTLEMTSWPPLKCMIG